MIGEAWLFALGLCGSLLFLVGVLHVPITALTAAICVLLAIALTYRTARKALTNSHLPLATSKQSALATALTLIPIVVILCAAAFIPLRDFDGRAFWLLKAKGIAHDHAIDGPFFHDQQVTDPRNDYPLLMPLNSAAVFLLGRTYNDTAVRWLYLLTFIAMALSVRARLGAWPAAILAWIPQFAVVTEGGALSAYNDVPLAAFVAAAYFELEDGRADPSSGAKPAKWSAFRFGCWLAFGALTKNEGLPLAFILLTAGIFVFRRRVLPALAPLGAALIALFAWKRSIPHGSDEDLAALFPTLPHQLHRLPGAIAGFAHHLLTPPWGLFWPAVLVAILWRLWKRQDPVPAFVIGATFALYLTVYTVTTWVQLDLINSSADRLLMHLTGPALFALASALPRNRVT